MPIPLALALVVAAADLPADAPAPAPVAAETAAPGGDAPAPEATPADAPFVGTVHFDVMVQGQPAKASYVRSPSGDTAVDVRIKDPHLRQTLRTTLIVLSGNPDEAWQIMHQARTFSRLALPAEAEAPRAERFVVTRRAPEALGARQVVPFHVVDTTSGDELSVWLDPTLGDLELFDRLYRGYQPDAPSLVPALRAHGGRGFPVRFKYTKKSVGQTVEGTLSAVEPGELDENVFAPPRGYVRVELPPGTSPIPLLSGPPSAKDVQSVIQGIMGNVGR